MEKTKRQGWINIYKSPYVKEDGSHNYHGNGWVFDSKEKAEENRGGSAITAHLTWEE